MIYCIYDSVMGVVLEIGRREVLLQVVNDVYDGNYSRYRVCPWEG